MQTRNTTNYSYEYRENEHCKWKLILKNDYGDDVEADCVLVPTYALETFRDMVNADRAVYKLLTRGEENPTKITVERGMRDLCGSWVDVADEDIGTELYLEDLDNIFGTYVSTKIWRDMLSLLMHDWIDFGWDDLFDYETEQDTRDDFMDGPVSMTLDRLSTLAVLSKLGFDIRYLSVTDDVAKKIEEIPMPE
jgi:hypothetical protein